MKEEAKRSKKLIIINLIMASLYATLIIQGRERKRNG
jgi:hypothetical protein